MENIIIKCTACGTKNRVPRDRINQKPICGKCRTPLMNISQDNSKPVDVTDATFQQEVLSFAGPVLVDCWAPWCGPCRMVSPILDELASAFSGRAKIVKLNVDENPVTASQFQVQSIPTLLFFKSGNLVDKIIGAQPKSEIEQRLLAIL